MCDDKLLCQMKSRQVKPKQLHCTQSSTCWCNDVSFRFPMEQIQDECMSPKQMLDGYSDQLSKSDKQLLTKLSGLEFIID
jgi:hypothetical protein